MYVDRITTHWNNIPQWGSIVVIFIETSVFTKQITSLLSEDSYQSLQNWISDQPDCGELIMGSGIHMKDQLFEDLLASVGEAGQILRGSRKPSRTFNVTALNVQEIRQGLNLSQSQFAALMHVSVKTLRNWEQGARVPGGAAAALLTAIRNDPKNVILALNAG
jgi:DNA-binding transcriptional regulator YiaG